MNIVYGLSASCSEILWYPSVASRTVRNDPGLILLHRWNGASVLWACLGMPMFSDLKSTVLLGSPLAFMTTTMRLHPRDELTFGGTFDITPILTSLSNWFLTASSSGRLTLLGLVTMTGLCVFLTSSLIGGDPVSIGFSCILQLFNADALNVLIIHSLAFSGSFSTSSHAASTSVSSSMGVSSLSGQLHVLSPSLSHVSSHFPASFDTSFSFLWTMLAKAITDRGIFSPGFLWVLVLITISPSVRWGLARPPRFSRSC